MSSTPVASAKPQAIPQRDFWIIMTLLIAAFVVILNETIMNVAISKLMTDFQVTASTAQWLATAYMLVMAVVIPTTGFLLQRFTTRALFLAAMGTFSVGTLVAGLAPTFSVLLFGRVLQASGTAIMLPLLTTTILSLIPLAQRGAMMGTVSIVISVAPAIGPTISGLIIGALSWRFMFFFVLPIALGVLVYGARNLINVGETKRSHLDVLSVILSALGFGGIVFGFSIAGEGEGWSSPVVWIALAVGVISLVAFVWRQLTLKEPLLDLGAFRFPMFTLSTVLIMVIMMALFASALLLPIYMQRVRQFSPLETGLLLLPGGLLMGLAAPFVGRVFDRSGPRMLVMTGIVLLTAVLVMFTTLNANSSMFEILALHITFSAGLALLFTPVFATGLNQLPRNLHSHGSAIFSTLQQVAGAVGTALLVTVMTTSSEAYAIANGGSEIDALTAGLHVAFAVAAGAAVVGLVLAFFMRRITSVEEEGGDLGQSAVSLH